MTNSISASGITTITPTLVLGYETATESKNVVHNLAGSSALAYTLVGDSPRSGSLRLFFSSAASASAARVSLGLAKVFTLSLDDISTAAMSFVRAGTMSLAIDETTLNTSAWVLTVGYQEVIV